MADMIAKRAIKELFLEHAISHIDLSIFLQKMFKEMGEN